MGTIKQPQPMAIIKLPVETITIKTSNLNMM
jgi:hypothetical protein